METIPLLVKSKMGVIDFFQGAGVSNVTLKDQRMIVMTDKDSTYKAEIVRTVLERLNARGDGALAERREVLRRVVEFEDFSACWESDQLKARGLVAQIRHVVNVKDSFTRMKMEREKEHETSRSSQREKTEALQTRNAEITRIKSDLFALFSMSADQSQKRGKLLEGILNRVFKINGILIRDAFEVKEIQVGVVEQIDGMVELDGKLFLVEMKWWNTPVGRQEISPHLVSVFTRPCAGGIFISQSRITDPAILECKNALNNEKIVILCELQEIVELLNRQDDLMEFLKKKLQVAIADKNPMYRVYQNS